jgi:hypothetical protein
MAVTPASQQGPIDGSPLAAVRGNEPAVAAIRVHPNGREAAVHVQKAGVDTGGLTGSREAADRIATES